MSLEVSTAKWLRLMGSAVEYIRWYTCQSALDSSSVSTPSDLPVRR